MMSGRVLPGIVARRPRFVRDRGPDPERADEPQCGQLCNELPTQSASKGTDDEASHAEGAKHDAPEQDEVLRPAKYEDARQPGQNPFRSVGRSTSSSIRQATTTNTHPCRKCGCSPLTTAKG